MKHCGGSLDNLTEQTEWTTPPLAKAHLCEYWFIYCLQLYSNKDTNESIKRLLPKITSRVVPSGVLRERVAQHVEY